MEARSSNGTFKNGHPGFKPRGSTNEFQKVTREKLGEFLKSKLHELPTIYESLGDRDKAKLLLSVSEFFLPKQREITVNDEESSKAVHVDYTKLSPAALKEVLSLTTIHDGTEAV